MGEQFATVLMHYAEQHPDFKAKLQAWLRNFAGQCAAIMAQYPDVFPPRED